VKAQRHTPESEREAVEPVTGPRPSAVQLAICLIRGLCDWATGTRSGKSKRHAAEIREARSAIFRLEAQLHLVEEERDRLKRAAWYFDDPAD
jgi:hypothetical protein